MAERPFVVFKHLPAEDDDDDEVYYDIGLETWITEINDDMTGKIIWPPDKIDAGPFVRRQKPHDTTWQAQPVIFKKFYPTYLEARAGCNNRIEDTNYDTDNVPTKRIRRVPRKLQDSSSSDDEKPDKRKKKRYAKVGDTACPASAKKQNGKPNKPVQLQISVKPIPAPPPLTMSKTQNLAPSQVKKSVKPTPASPLPTMSKTQDLAPSQVKNSVKPIPPPPVVAMSTPNKNPAPASPLPTLLKNPKIRLPIQIEVVSKQTDAMGRSARQCSSKCGMEANDIDSGRGSVNECDDSIPLSSDDLQQHSGSEHGCDFLEDDDNNSDKQESGRSAHKEDDNTMLTSTSQGDQLEQHQLTDEKSVTLADVMKELKKINSKLEFLGINQENLCRHVLPGQKYTKRPSGMPNLPVNSLKEVKALEDFLSNDGNLSSAITYYSKFLSKGDLGKSVRTLLGKMIEKNLARYFTQTGENGKQSFQSTKMWDLITVGR